MGSDVTYRVTACHDSETHTTHRSGRGGGRAENHALTTGGVGTSAGELRVAPLNIRDMSRIVKARFFFLLNRAQKAVKTRFERETRAHLDGLTSLELGALWALTADPSLGVQDLAAVLHVDHAVVSRLSKQLDRKKVARRVADPDDGRRTRLEVTDLGATRAAQGRRMLRSANARLREGFTDDELTVVVRFLNHLIAIGAETGPLDAPQDTPTTKGNDDG